MWRTAGLIGLAWMSVLCLACPKLIDEGQAPGSGESIQQLQRVPSESGGNAEVDGALPPADAQWADPPLAGPPLPTAISGESAPPSGPQLPVLDGGLAGGAPPVDRGEHWIDPLDPASVLGVAGTAGSEPGDSHELRAQGQLSGAWVVVSVNQQGRGIEVDLQQDRWSYTFMENQRCSVALGRGGDHFIREGNWELTGGELTLEMGPGGTKQYTIEFDPVLPDICLLKEAPDTTLFCVRAADQASLPELSGSYSTTFGELSLRPAGGASWDGDYGQPQGSLRLYALGATAAGGWTQGANQGCLVLCKTAEGFTGRWWYLNSVRIEGSWDGRSR